MGHSPVTMERFISWAVPAELPNGSAAPIGFRTLVTEDGGRSMKGDLVKSFSVWVRGTRGLAA